ncbi:MAG: DUF1611 domain-containing protein [Desulfobacteraceae bacterium]|nr:MAG: DUF1611 domain-containing protein [Desulfobacteraceae bacterium]
MAQHGPLREVRLARAKAAYTTRRVNLRAVEALIDQDVRPAAGDLLLARVEKLGQHKRLELTNGRKAQLFAGDEIIVAYGNRYAPDQFESVIPESLESCHLVAGGGIASKFLVKHSKMKMPTQIAPIAILGDRNGEAINLSDFALSGRLCDRKKPPVVAVVGTSMNSGKTTTASDLIHGLSRAGLRVGAAKVTGTGSGGDPWCMWDAGAVQVYDFTDAGYASTYLLETEKVIKILQLLVQHLCASGTEAIVLEVADGLYQKETETLLSSRAFAETVDGVIFTLKDSIGGKEGVQRLLENRLNVMAVGGVICQSPLAMRELENTVRLPVVDSNFLRNPDVKKQLGRWIAASKEENVIRLSEAK